jgi:hypothetical protein
MQNAALIALLTIFLLPGMSSESRAQSSIFFSPVNSKDFAVILLNEIVREDIHVDSSMIAPEIAKVEVIQGWRTWSVAENFSFGKNRGQLTMINDLNALHPYFRDKVKQLIAQCKAKGIDLVIVETFRTHAKQNEYKGMGRNYTSTAGGRSRHQYGLAVDVVPVVNNKPVWDNTALWKKIGMTGESLGLRWGGRWKRPYDPAHFEWTGGLTSVHLSTGKLPTVPADKYPSIDEDIERLRRYWQEWEMFQGASTRK